MTEQELKERKDRATRAALRAADPILTLREAARYLRFKDPDTVAGLAKRGVLCGSKKGGKWSFRRSWLDHFHDVKCRYVSKFEQQEKRDGLFGEADGGL